MKIAVISSHTPSIFWFRMDMMQAFIRYGCEVIAIGNEAGEKWIKKFKDYNIRYYGVEVRRNGLNPIDDFRYFRQLRKVLKSECPDKLFLYQAKSVIYGGLAANTLGIKEIYPLIAGIGSVFISDNLKAKVIRTILTLEYKLAMKNSKNVFFQNKDDAEFFTKNRIIPANKIVYINGSGVNIDKFTVQPFPEKFGFLCIARLIRDKGIGEYLKACRMVKQQHPAVRCLLVGPYDSNPSAIKPKELQKYIDDGIIEYFGEQEDVRPYLEQCTVFVLPSYREGTPKAVLEAMACGKAVITTDAPGCRETVADGVNGYLVPVKEVKSLADKMVELINNQELCHKFGQAGRKLVEEKFDVRIVNRKILETMNII